MSDNSWKPDKVHIVLGLALGIVSCLALIGYFSLAKYKANAIEVRERLQNLPTQEFEVELPTMDEQRAGIKENIARLSATQLSELNEELRIQNKQYRREVIHLKNILKKKNEELARATGEVPFYERGDNEALTIDDLIPDILKEFNGDQNSSEDNVSD